MIINYIKVLLVFVLSTSSVFGQIDYDKVKSLSNSIFLNDVYLYKGSSENFHLHDIRIKDGLIEAIGIQLEPSYDAIVIEADSLYVYPSFIDLLSHTGLEKPERRQDRPDVKFPGHPSNEIAGITPEKSLVKNFKPKSSSIKGMREAGFAMAHVVPRGTMLPGQGSLVSLGESEDLILDNDISVFMQFSGTRGVYPSTIIGVMAKWRDLYNNASYLNQHEKAYYSQPLGKKRPKRDVSLSALIPLVKNTKPLFAKAESTRNVFRALELQKELGYDLTLVNVKSGWAAIEKIKDQNVNVALSLDLPKSEKKSKGDKKEKPGEEKEKGQKPGAKAKDKDKDKEDDPEVKALKERKAKSIKEFESQAAKFQDANVPFAFSMLSTKASDLKKNLKRMVNAGLNEDTALSALTENPAQILGIDNVTGSIEPGKFANLIILSKPYFDDESNMRFTVVEGYVTEIPKKEKKKAGKSDGAVTGDWSYTIDMGEMQRSGVMKINLDNEVYEVEITDDEDRDNPLSGKDVEISEGAVSFYVEVEDDTMGTMVVNIEVLISGSELEGTISIDPMGSFPMTGTKINSPE